jgi:biopolymer transport protein ExbB
LDNKTRFLAVAYASSSVALLLGSSPQVLAQQTQTPAAEQPEGFFDIVFAGGIVGDTIMWALFALSLTAAYLVFEHIMTLRRKVLMPPGLAENLRRLVSEGRVAEAEQLCRNEPSFLSFVLLNGLAEMEGGWQSVEKALEDSTAEQAARLLRRIEYLSAIGNIAPMLGLLGTVTGMIGAFQTVARTQGTAGAGDLARGIYEALVTTVGGLVIAIPALGAFAIFRNRVDELVAEAAYLAQHAFAPIKRPRTKWRETAPAAPPPPPLKGGV